jgi:hypothetical protein
MGEAGAPAPVSPTGTWSVHPGSGNVKGGSVSSATTVKKRVVERYIEGFKAGDHEMILACLTDDVAWEMPPYFKLNGRTAFDNAIENDASPGLPDIQLLVSSRRVTSSWPRAPYRPR